MCGRSYKLYLKLAGTEVQPGSTLTAADAAAGYEEVLKSQKQASPIRTGKTTRIRPASGAPSSAQHAISKPGAPAAACVLLHAGSCHLGRLRHVCSVLLLHVSCASERDHRIAQPEPSLMVLAVG